jgi:glycosyltransferase involved in cell wall biosynthesis
LKILYLHQYFRTPEQGGIIRSYYLAKALIEKGHEVHMITASNQNRWYERQIEGIHVHYLPVFYENKLNYPQRIWAFSKYFLLAFLKGLNIQKIDLCFATSTPLTVGILGLCIKHIKQVPLVFEVRDIWPKAPVELRVLTNPWIITLAERMEKVVYNASDDIITLSPAMQEHVSKISSKSSWLVPNMSDCRFFAPSTNEEEKLKMGFSNFLVVGYYGAIGVANDVAKLIRLAKRTKNQSIIYLVMGRGKEYHKIMKLAKEYELENVQFMDFVGKSELRMRLQYIDAAYISFASFPVLETCSPNKFFDSLAAGKLILTNTRGWLADLAEEKSFGVYLDDKNPDLNRLYEFVHDHAKRKLYQKNARKVAEEYFERETLATHFVECLENVLNK